MRDFAERAYTAELQRIRVRYEDKEAIAAFHWRGAPDEHAAERAVQEIARRAQEEGFAVHWGRKVLEVRPPVEFDKGLGIAALVRGEEVEAAVYVGDDTTDLDAFRALRALVASGELRTALCVAVRSDESPRTWLVRRTSQSMARGVCGGCSRRCCSAVRFVDFLRTTVLLSAGAATALAAVTVLAAAADSNHLLVPVSVGWWLLASAIGMRQGRRAQTSPPIARLLATARTSNSLPEHHPSAILLNRLWPLLLFTLLAGGLGFLAPQVPGIAAGFAIIWALAWRRQDAAVQAIEERDGATFYVRRTSPLRPMALLRTPGFKASRTQGIDGAVT